MREHLERSSDTAIAFAELERIAEELDDVRLARDARDLADQTSRVELNVAVVGQFKRGKSTFVNALLGTNVLPTGALPLTGVGTKVRFGERPKATVAYTDGRIQEISVEEIGRYVRESENARNRLGVDHVIVELPDELLRMATFIDTPGIGSTYVHNSETARDLLRQTDLAILVVGPDPPIGEGELAFAAQVRNSSERLFVVLNKADQAGDALPRVIDFTADALAEVLGNRPNVFATDSRGSLAQIRTELERFLAAHRDAVLQRSIERRTNQIARQLLDRAALHRGALLVPIEERTRRRELFARIAVELRDHSADIASAIAYAVDEEMRALDEILERLYDAGVSALEADADVYAAAGRTSEADGLLRTRVGETTKQWYALAAGAVRERGERRVAKIERQTADLERELIGAGLEALGVAALREIDVEETFRLPALTFIRADQPTTSLEIVQRGLIDLLPQRARAALLRRRLPAQIREVLDAARGRLRYALLRDLRSWVRSSQAQVRERFDSAEAAVLQAFDKASDFRADAAIHARLHELEGVEAALRRIAARSKRVA